MPIAIKASLANQIRAYHQAHPASSSLDIAHHFGVQPVLVRNALGLSVKRRIKSVVR